MTVHLENELGDEVKDIPEGVRLITELVYEDGTPAPVATLKQKEFKTGSTNLLFRPFSPEPIIGSSSCRNEFIFRIEEVSFHHPGQSGVSVCIHVLNVCSFQSLHERLIRPAFFLDPVFPQFRLRVSSTDSLHCIHPGLSQTISVLSKPSNLATYATSAESRKRHYPASQTLNSNVRKKANMSSVEIGMDTYIKIPIKSILSLFARGGYCFCCGKLFLDINCTMNEHHPSCHFLQRVQGSIMSAHARAKNSNSTQHSVEDTRAQATYWKAGSEPKDIVRPYILTPVENPTQEHTLVSVTVDESCATHQRNTVESPEAKKIHDRLFDLAEKSASVLDASSRLSETCAFLDYVKCPTVSLNEGKGPNMKPNQIDVNSTTKSTFLPFASERDGDWNDDDECQPVKIPFRPTALFADLDENILDDRATMEMSPSILSVPSTSFEEIVTDIEGDRFVSSIRVES